MTLSPIKNSNSHIPLEEGEILAVNPGKAQAWRGVKMSTNFSSGLFESIKRIFWGSATLFSNLFTGNSEKGGWVLVEESTPGALNKYSLTKGKEIHILKTSWVASSENVDLGTEFVGTRGLFSNTGLAMVRATLKAAALKGEIYFKADQGIIREVELTPEDSPLVVDNDAILAYTSGVTQSITHAGSGMKSFCFGGENLVSLFQGKGTVYLSSIPNKEATPIEVHHHHHRKSDNSKQPY